MPVPENFCVTYCSSSRSTIPFCSQFYSTEDYGATVLTTEKKSCLPTPAIQTYVFYRLSVHVYTHTHTYTHTYISIIKKSTSIKNGQNWDHSKNTSVGKEAY